MDKMSIIGNMSVKGNMFPIMAILAIFVRYRKHVSYDGKNVRYRGIGVFPIMDFLPVIGNIFPIIGTLFSIIGNVRYMSMFPIMNMFPITSVIVDPV